MENEECSDLFEGSQEYEESADSFTLGQPCVMDELAYKQVTNL